MLRLRIFLTLLTPITLSACFGSEESDTQGPQLKTPQGEISLSPLDTLQLEFDESVSFKAANLVADSNILYSIANPNSPKIQLYGAQNFLDQKSMALPWLKPDTSYDILLQNVPDLAGNTTATQRFKIQTLPMAENEFWARQSTNQTPLTADTLMIDGAFARGALKGQSQGQQAFAGIIAGNYSEAKFGIDREDYLALELSYGDSLKLQLKSRGNLKMSLRGPFLAGTESMAEAAIDGKADNKNNTVELNYVADQKRHLDGLQNSDPKAKALRYWVLIEYADHVQGKSPAYEVPTPYTLTIYKR
jgi:hypothetical protein